VATRVSQSSGLRAGGLALGIGFTLPASLCLALIGTFAKSLAPFNYPVVVFSAPIGWAIFHEVPNWLTGLGIVLVTLGGVLSTYHRRAAPAPVPARPVGAAIFGSRG
jgi:drug/metabolite transporter (DMT)-like permease